MKVSNEVANILAESRIEDNKLYLPDVQLERKLYTAVNKVLDAIGGKWNTRAKAHIFKSDPNDAVEEILQSGEYTTMKKEFQFFETPDALAKRLVDMAGIRERETVLEPSAGRGQIAQFIPGAHCVELNEDNRNFLTDNGYNVVGDDFMKFNKRYDVIIANPPFTRQQDIDHVNRMIDLAARKVVSVMSASVLFRENKKTIAFRKRVEQFGGSFEPLPVGSFAASGTKANTCIVSIDMPPV